MTDVLDENGMFMFRIKYHNRDDSEIIRDVAKLYGVEKMDSQASKAVLSNLRANLFTRSLFSEPHTVAADETVSVDSLLESALFSSSYNCFRTNDENQSFFSSEIYSNRSLNNFSSFFSCN